jgi:hypothetical protein
MPGFCSTRATAWSARVPPRRRRRRFRGAVEVDADAALRGLPGPRPEPGGRPGRRVTVPPSSASARSRRLRSSSSSASLLLTRSRASSSTLLVLGISFLSSRQLYASRVVSYSGVWQSHSDGDYSYSQIAVCHSGHLDEGTRLSGSVRCCAVPVARVKCAPRSRPGQASPWR